MTKTSNPFRYGKPVPPARFIGRTDVLRTVFSRLINGESTAIVGGLQIGKSSFLHYICDERVHAEWLHDLNSYAFVNIDCHLLPGSYQPANFWNQVLVRIEEVFKERAIQHQLEIVRQSNYDSFALQRLFGLLGQREQRVVVLIDEFDVLLNHPNFNTHEFFGSLRSFAVNTDGLALLTAGRMRMSEMNRRTMEINPFGSPFFNNLIEVQLPPLHLEEIDLLLDQSLASTAISFDAEERALVRHLSGHHPFLVQMAAAALFEELTQPEQQGDRTARIEHYVLGRATAHFDNTWQHLSPNLRRALLRVLLAERQEAALGALASNDNIDLRWLAESGLITRSEDTVGLLWQGESWRVSAGAFASWLVERRKWEEFAQAQRNTLAPERAKHLRELLYTQERRLEELKLQAATKGSDTAAHIKMEIKDLEREIAQGRRELLGGAPSDG